jgi:hypothetical protein
VLDRNDDEARCPSAQAARIPRNLRQLHRELLQLLRLRRGALWALCRTQRFCLSLLRISLSLLPCPSACSSSPWALPPLLASHRETRRVTAPVQRERSALLSFPPSPSFLHCLVRPSRCQRALFTSKLFVLALPTLLRPTAGRCSKGFLGPGCLAVRRPTRHETRVQSQLVHLGRKCWRPRRSFNQERLREPLVDLPNAKRVGLTPSLSHHLPKRFDQCNSFRAHCT